ncbi:hypothetical protein XENORESO_012559 [Xenotaenia resolanae]|uniref:Uncharacterized protein n=1 Tax=Xenotaenia resolanae TaxID=208358 RepID=A0ABV0W1W0_9TELE
MTGDCALTIPFHSVHLRLPVQDKTVICKNTQMILQSCGVSEMDKKLSTGSWWTALCRNDHLEQEMIVYFKRNGNRSNTISIMGEEVKSDCPLMHSLVGILSHRPTILIKEEFHRSARISEAIM